MFQFPRLLQSDKPVFMLPSYLLPQAESDPAVAPFLSPHRQAEPTSLDYLYDPHTRSNINPFHPYGYNYYKWQTRYPSPPYQPVYVAIPAAQVRIRRAVATT